MALKFGQTDELVNTQYAPLAVLLAHFQQNQVLKPIECIDITMRSRDFTPQDKLKQIFVSMLAGCKTLSEVNQTLKSELFLAQVDGWPRFADQSSLSRMLDALTLMNIEALRDAETKIWQTRNQTWQHDWRGYLWFDFDLSGLPCSKRAEASQKGYFSGKKTRPVAN